MTIWIIYLRLLPEFLVFTAGMALILVAFGG